MANITSTSIARDIGRLSWENGQLVAIRPNMFFCESFLKVKADFLLAKMKNDKKQLFSNKIEHK